jgi:hypothetical protein
MTLKEKMDEGIQEIQVKLARAKLETNYSKKVRLMAEVADMPAQYAEYWEERLADLRD